jgi:phosphate-selective porin OprO/OprP
MPRGPDCRLAKFGVGIGVIALVLSVVLAAPAFAQWQITSPDGQSSLKLGYLLQGRGEWERIGTDSDATTSQNLYLRRIRLLFGGKINDRLSFFAETDAPNWGKADTTGLKAEPDVYLQDFMATWTVKDALLLDFGLLLTPGAYNHLQSAASLLALDYGPYTFVESVPLKARIGRDVGVQARGVVFGKHVEYRAALLQGVRGRFAQNSFRTAGHLSFTPFEAANSLFYSGTSLGKKKALTVGLGADAQQDYRAYFGDACVDYPLASGEAVTLQGNYATYDGGDFLGSALYRQHTYMIEAGLTFVAQKITPFVQVSGRTYDDHEGRNEQGLQFGVAYWLDGHKSNVKAGYTLLKRDGSADHALFTVQCQAFSF